MARGKPTYIPVTRVFRAYCVNLPVVLNLPIENPLLVSVFSLLLFMFVLSFSRKARTIYDDGDACMYNLECRYNRIHIIYTS